MFDKNIMPRFLMKHLMNNGSVLMIENHYMPFVIKYNQFDTFYHEHLRTYSFKSLIYLLKMYGIKIFDASVTDRYGGTIRIFASLDHKRKTTVNYHDYLDERGKKVFQWTVIGERTVPIDQCDYDVDPQ